MMKPDTQQRPRIIYLLASMLLIVTAALANRASADNTPVGTTFTYQGRLTEADQPVNQPVDFVFRLFGVEAGGSPLPGG